MAIVVTHKEKGGKFAVLGANFNKWVTSHNSSLFQIPVYDEGSDRILVVTGQDGRIQFAHADEFRVLTIDGVAIADALG